MQYNCIYTIFWVGKGVENVAENATVLPNIAPLEEVFNIVLL